MNIIHPQQPIGGLNTEDTFLATDDLGVRTGIGYILYQLQPGIYPDCPVNMYFSLEAEPSSRYMLLGALIARARVLQGVNPHLKARLYTGLGPDDVQLKEFYLANGFDCEGADVLIQLQMPYGDGRIPMSCTVAPTPSNR